MILPFADDKIILTAKLKERDKIEKAMRDFEYSQVALTLDKNPQKVKIGKKNLNKRANRGGGGSRPYI